MSAYLLPQQLHKALFVVSYFFMPQQSQSGVSDLVKIAMVGAWLQWQSHLSVIVSIVLILFAQLCHYYRPLYQQSQSNISVPVMFACLRYHWFWAV